MRSIKAVMLFALILALILSASISFAQDDGRDDPDVIIVVPPPVRPPAQPDPNDPPRQPDPNDPPSSQPDPNNPPSSQPDPNDPPRQPDPNDPPSSQPDPNVRPDGDGDGIPDPDDLCPTLAGPLSTYGCPDTTQDSDGDGIPDPVDECPLVAGSESNGCLVDDFAPNPALPDDGECYVATYGPQRVNVRPTRSTDNEPLWQLDPSKVYPALGEYDGWVLLEDGGWSASENLRVTPDCETFVMLGIGVQIIFRAIKDCNNNGIDDLDEFFPPDCYGKLTSGGSTAQDGGAGDFRDCNGNGINDLDEFLPPDCYVLTSAEDTSDASINIYRPADIDVQQRPAKDENDCNENGVDDLDEYPLPVCIGGLSIEDSPETHATIDDADIEAMWMSCQPGGWHLVSNDDGEVTGYACDPVIED